MATYSRFEELHCWQKARELANFIYDLTRKSSFNKDLDLKRDIRRAASSAMHNIAEGFNRGNNKEFVYFLGIAKGSEGEIQSQLYLSLDQKYITDEEFKKGYYLCDQVIASTHNFIIYLRKSKFQGMRKK